MSRSLHALALALATGLLALVGCNSPGIDAASARADGVTASVPVEEARDGTQKHVVLTSEVDGVDISFELFEPDRLEPGQSYPLVLHGHGYGGSRITERSGFVARLTAAGYYVISIDQRGFGESGGTVRVLSPDFEGQDLVQILDWAEDLPGLARRDGNMLIGAYGGSYGGGYQLTLLGADPENRLDALVPDITWHDLRYSLAPNGIIKSGWILALVAAGEQGSNLGQDNFIRETLVLGTLDNNFPESAANLFAYHSPIYHCDRLTPQPQEFLIATPDPGNVASRRLPGVDVMLTQGMRDTLFNFNEAVDNFQCLRALGGDVRLLTHESGHILPVALPEEVKDSLDPLFALVNVPEFQDGGGPRDCGNVSLTDAQFAWFEEKLRGQSGAVDAALESRRDVCISLGDGDAVALDNVPHGGTEFTLDVSTPQLNSVLGIVGSLLGNGVRELVLADIPLMTVPEGGAVVAGVPTMQLEVSGLSGLEFEQCPLPLLETGCDPLYFLGLSVRKAGQTRFELIDDQLTPIRGFGTFGSADAPMEMSGIAERLEAGDTLALQIYAFHVQYPITWSRDLIVPAATFAGSVQVPFLD